MEHVTTPLERAFELAYTGSYASIAAIKRKLVAEGRSLDQIEGQSLTTQLKALIAAARS